MAFTDLTNFSYVAEQVTASNIATARTLKNLAKGQPVFISGADEAGDGGGGFFVYDPDTVTDDGIDNLVLIHGGSLLRETIKRADLPYVDVREFESLVSSGDWAPAFSAAANATPESGVLYIPPQIFALDSEWAIEKAININCQGEILLGSAAGYINFEQTPIATVSGTTLSALPVKGDTALAWTTAPSVTFPSDCFVVFESTENEITRIGNVAYVPYTKNETNEVTTHDWQLRAPINLTYTNAAALTIKIFRKQKQTAVDGLRIKVNPTPTQTIKSAVVWMQGASNILMRNSQVYRQDTNWAGTNLLVYQCCGLTFDHVDIRAGNSSANDSYAFQVSNAAFLHFNRCSYVDGDNVAKRERGYVARHGNHVSFSNCRFSGVDDHYGHNYVIEGLHGMQRGVGISGGSVTIRDSSSTGCYLMNQRSDAPYSDGALLIENCTTNYGILQSVRETDAATTKRKVWDDITIRDTKIVGTSAVAAINVAEFLAGDSPIQTTSITLDNVRHERRINHISCRLFQGSSSGEDGGSLFKWVKDFRINRSRSDIFDYVHVDSNTYRSVLNLVCANSLLIADSHNIFSDYATTDLTEYKGGRLDDRVGGAFFYTITGLLVFRGVTLDAEIAVGGSVGSSMVDCIVTGNIFSFSSGAGFAASMKYMQGNRALLSVDLSAAPGSLASYINTGTYKVT